MTSTSIVTNEDPSWRLPELRQEFRRHVMWLTDTIARTPVVTREHERVVDHRTQERMTRTAWRVQHNRLHARVDRTKGFQELHAVFDFGGQLRDLHRHVGGPHHMRQGPAKPTDAVLARALSTLIAWQRQRTHWWAPNDEAAQRARRRFATTDGIQRTPGHRLTIVHVAPLPRLHHEWLLNLATGVCVRALTPLDLLDLDGFPPLGTVVELQGERFEVVDGIEFATHRGA